MHAHVQSAQLRSVRQITYIIHQKCIHECIALALALALYTYIHVHVHACPFCVVHLMCVIYSMYMYMYHETLIKDTLNELVRVHLIDSKCELRPLKRGHL